MIEAVARALVQDLPLALVIALAAGWLIRDMRAVKADLSRVAATAESSHTALIALEATLAEKVKTADREHEILRASDSAIDRRVRFLERAQMGLAGGPENGG